MFIFFRHAGCKGHVTGHTAPRHSVCTVTLTTTIAGCKGHVTGHTDPRHSVCTVTLTCLVISQAPNFAPTDAPRSWNTL